MVLQAFAAAVVIVKDVLSKVTPIESVVPGEVPLTVTVVPTVPVVVFNEMVKAAA